MIKIMRHAQAEHNMNEPESFNLKKPKLTDKGRRGTKNISEYIDQDSQFWVSPTVRTIETAMLLSHNNKIKVVDILGPRVYPHRKGKMNICDQMFSNYNDKNVSTINLLNNKHPNDLEHQSFIKEFQHFIKKYIKDDENNVIITHDGVIATLLEQYKNIKLERDENNDLMLNNEIFQFTKSEILG
ncbi:histidine phosphatase family protein [Mammaliicoccus lentus]|uniref:histidine phosphatase family protein n=1 Tax=Mammaliicoccus lentus TaxID=42858 RepID=UPI001E2A08A1|nr:histidine phosphatase family protein [Mammaliicoccus lentus]MCD2478026.1 histidine phosphatase family protein [Mammaliicoccus lentus]MCD2521206.1 histidine phosphatase family protein [Mammaliicoccus lentus]